MELYRESVEMAQAEIMEALTGPGVTPGRARHLIAALVAAVRDVAVNESVDGYTATLEALAPRLGMPADVLIGMVDRNGNAFEDDDCLGLPHVVTADLSRN